LLSAVIHKSYGTVFGPKEQLQIRILGCIS
jgi:hypothetical protein